MVQGKNTKDLENTKKIKINCKYKWNSKIFLLYRNKLGMCIEYI